MSAPETQSGAAALDDDERDFVRSLILADPGLVLDDDRIVRVLIGAQPQRARNVVDLRDRLVERMEERLQKLMRTNRSVIAAAYENVATADRMHRAVLALIEAEDAGAFLRRLVRDLPTMTGIEEARLCIEADVDAIRAADDLASGLDGRVLIVPEGMIGHYMHAEAGHAEDGAPPPIVLRRCTEEREIVFGHVSPSRSEALLPLDMGDARGLLALGAADPELFSPDQGTDLLTFVAGAVQRLLIRHLGGNPPG